MIHNLRDEMWNAYYAIAADIEHGECFYDEQMLEEFHKDIDKLKAVTLKMFEEYQEEIEEDEGSEE